MDLGISGKKALVCGASQGLGFACAQSLVNEGVEVVIAARTWENLQKAQLFLEREQGQWAENNNSKAFGVHVVCVDVTSPKGREQIKSNHPEIDILVTNAGGPASGDFRNWQRGDWLEALDANMLSPIELIKAYLDPMMAKGFGRIINITSSAVKSPLHALGLSNGARAGLTGFVAGLARQSISRGVTINNLLPGTFETQRLKANFTHQAKLQGLPYETVIQERLDKHPAKRFGQAHELGQACAFLCGIHSGYINGQNVLLDGGSFLGS
jgi:3-oxoacyl-[acyl-carrier protein] reductase